MTLHWFLSRRVRVATHMYKHVQKVLDAQRDLLSAEAILNMQQAIGDLRNTVRSNPRRAVLDAKVTDFEAAANKWQWLKPYPNSGLRENIEVFLVAIAVVMGIRTFFLTNFKIPTGSMQPTLFGITHENFIDRPEVQFPHVAQRFFTYWYRGVSHTHVVAQDSGRLRIIDEQPMRLLLFNLRQRFQIGNVVHTIWFPPDSVFRRAGLIGPDGGPIPRIFSRGEDVMKLKVISGD
jgi:signal peptidase I